MGFIKRTKTNILRNIAASRQTREASKVAGLQVRREEAIKTAQFRERHKAEEQRKSIKTGGSFGSLFAAPTRSAAPTRRRAPARMAAPTRRRKTTRRRAPARRVPTRRAPARPSGPASINDIRLPNIRL